eukprot:TRINITY_DN38782_c0_g1_i7.p2 TRINITY_DN38782_c0_g1~~TRINITY_DN38782_c0_g1_i7.p2  ORF type:complete len:101 (+),score=9.95 TRINITY_DN38782_c0_g1_i7:132-434(+)
MLHRTLTTGPKSQPQKSAQTSVWLQVNKSAEQATPEQDGKMGNVVVDVVCFVSLNWTLLTAPAPLKISSKQRVEVRFVPPCLCNTCATSAAQLLSASREG